MPDREGFPPGVPCWIDLWPPAPDEAVTFYGGLLGWEFDERTPPGAGGRYIVAQLGGQDVAAIGDTHEPEALAPVWSTYVCVGSAEDTAAAVRAAGGRVDAGPFDLGDFGRTAVCADPAGAAFRLWQPGSHRGAQLVNAPGSWNWSDLHTRDPQGAVEFYGAVFGWVAATTEFGDALMWQVPGYGDVLAERDPTLRERHADPGVPAGFSDAIGWLQPIAADTAPADVASHWHVTFAVDDADATAARAAELGGAVVAEPMDAGPVRMAEIADPWGGEFTVSRYQPG
jgi:predicted enzyme related to lactoylglutathione lyase